MRLYKYFSEKSTLRFLGTLLVRFTPPLVFNDPFECRPSFIATDEAEQKREWFWREVNFMASPRAELEIALSNRVGLLCLTETPLNLLMWAHYGENHRGAAIEFDADHPFFKDPHLTDGRINLLRRVTYRRKRPQLHLDFFRRHQFFTGVEQTGWKELVDNEHELFFVKSRDWAYEREWRLLRPFPSAQPEKHHRRWYTYGSFLNPDAFNTTAPKEQLIQIPPDAIKSVILGARAREADSHTFGFEGDILRLLKNSTDLSGIRIDKIRFGDKNFSLVRYSLESLEELRAHVHPQELAIRMCGYHGGVIPK